MIPTENLDFMPKLIETAKEKALQDPRHIHKELGIRTVKPVQK